MSCFLAEGAPRWSIALAPSLSRPFSTPLHRCYGLILAACIAFWMNGLAREVWLLFFHTMFTWQKTYKVLCLPINSTEKQVLSTEGRAFEGCGQGASEDLIFSFQTTFTFQVHLLIVCALWLLQSFLCACTLEWSHPLFLGIHSWWRLWWVNSWKRVSRSPVNHFQQGNSR